MKPVYFPFTSVSESTLKALSSCFRQMTVYQPSSRKLPQVMREWRENGFLDIRVSGDDEKLENIIREYRGWAELHKDGGMAFFKTRKDTIPFFDDTSVFEIRASIKKGKAGKETEPEKADPLLNARIFLCIAQEFDIQNLELNHDLVSFKKMEQELMSDLRGEASVFETENSKTEIPKDDPGHYMTAERLNAWSRLMTQDTESAGVFLTDSQAVLDILLDKTPQTVKLIHSDALSPREDKKKADELIRHLDVIAENEWPGGVETKIEMPDHMGDGDISLRLFVVPGESPSEFFGRCAGHEAFQNKGGKYRNTVLGFIEF